MDGMACAIVVSTARIVSGTIACRTCKGIGVPTCGEVIPVRTVGHGTDMTLNMGSVAAIVSADGCCVVVYAWGAVRHFGNTVSNTRHAVRGV